MKRMFTTILALASVYSFAQKSASPANSIDLKSGQKFVAVTVTDMSMDMGMGGEIKNKTNSTMVMNVTSVNGGIADVDYAISKVALSMEVGGNETKYDSEIEADNDSEIGKSMKDKIGKSERGTINLQTGVFTPSTTDEEDNNPFSKIMNGGNNSNSFSGAFILFDKSKQVGDSWTVNNNSEGATSSTTYKVTAINGDEATLDFKTVSDINTEVEVQEMKMTLVMNNKSNGVMIVNPNTGLVKKNSSNLEIEGHIEVMGQQNPISATGTSVTTIN